MNASALYGGAEETLMKMHAKVLELQIELIVFAVKLRHLCLKSNDEYEMKTL